MNWGYGVMIGFVLFAGYILALVTGCFQQDIDLVSEDYYVQEVAYQKRIQDIENAKPFEDQILISRDQEQVSVQFPQGISNLISKGSVQFFRPSDVKKDILIDLATMENGEFSVPLSQLSAGKYEVHIHWEVEDQGYFVKKILFI